MTNIGFTGAMYIVKLRRDVFSFDQGRMNTYIRDHFGIPVEWSIKYRYSDLNPRHLEEHAITIDALALTDDDPSDPKLFAILWVPLELTYNNGWVPRPRTTVDNDYEPTPSHMVWDDARNLWLWVDLLTYNRTPLAMKINRTICPYGASDVEIGSLTNNNKRK